MKQSTSVYKPISAFRLTMIVILLVSLIFPVFFAYIDNNLTWKVVLRELVFTLARLSGIAFICYGVIYLTGRIAGRQHWLRNIAELLLIFFFTYWFLFYFVEWIDRPLTGSNPADPALWTFRRYIGLYMLGTIFIYTFLSGLNFYQLAREKAAQAERLQRDYAQVRLQALKSQVNPHFLFNSLSVLSSLVHVNSELSEQFIIHLSKAYRYILDQKEHQMVTLKEELSFLDAYFFLLQIRFENKIRLEQSIDIDPVIYQLPPLTLQLLTENAVKHNKMSGAEPLAISIRAEGEWLVVENMINRRDQHETSTGVGLENIQKRYAMLTDKKVIIEPSEQTFTVKIPLLKA